MKLLLFILLASKTLFSYEQVVFVLANNMNSTEAKLIRYEKIDNKFIEVSNPILVNLGKHGLAWNYEEKSESLFKKEGDKKAPAGSFKLSRVFGYEKHVFTKMPYTKSTKNHICVDDSTSNFYNQIIKTKNKKQFKSYENMILSNDTYKYVVVIDYNYQKQPQKGSCIFLHVEDKKKKTTSGCTSMKEKDLKNIVSWLDISKNPIFIQIPKSKCEEYRQKYNFLKCSLSIEN